MARRHGIVKMDTQRLMRESEKLTNLKVAITAADDIAVASASTYFSGMQKRFRNAFRNTKDYIKNQATTKTGQERKALGLGYAGRYSMHGGDMYRAFVMTQGGGRTSKGRNKQKVRFFAEMGWLKGMPGYTLFQEYGTRNGIKGMEALEQARYDVRTQVEEEHAKGKAEIARQIAEGFFFAARTGLTTRTSQPNATWWKKFEVNEDGD